MVIIKATPVKLLHTYRYTLFGLKCKKDERRWASVILLRSSGLDDERRLAVDLPESRTVQSRDHPGAASPLRDEILDPGQGGAPRDQTETSKARVRRIY